MISLNKQPQTTMDLISLILINQMNIKQDHVSIYDQKWVIPPFDDLFLVVEYRNGQPIANNNKFINCEGFETPIEIQSVYMLEKIVVGVFSRNRDAELRKEEVLMAIMSSYAQLQQETWAFKIARVAPIADLSYVEGSAILKRYDIELSVYAWYEKKIIPGWINPPFNIKIYDNDPGDGLIIETITAESQLAL